MQAKNVLHGGVTWNINLCFLGNIISNCCPHNKFFKNSVSFWRNFHSKISNHISESIFFSYDMLYWISCSKFRQKLYWYIHLSDIVYAFMQNVLSNCQYTRLKKNYFYKNNFLISFHWFLLVLWQFCNSGLFLQLQSTFLLSLKWLDYFMRTWVKTLKFLSV